LSSTPTLENRYFNRVVLDWLPSTLSPEDRTGFRSWSLVMCLEH
jgi:hypothetical protein